MTQVNGQWVELWPDNDGGLWTYGENGEVITIDDERDVERYKRLRGNISNKLFGKSKELDQIG